MNPRQALDLRQSYLRASQVLGHRHMPPHLALTVVLEEQERKKTKK